VNYEPVRQSKKWGSFNKAFNGKFTFSEGPFLAVKIGFRL